MRHPGDHSRPCTSAEGAMNIKHLVLSMAAAIIVLSVAPGDARPARARGLEATADLLLSLDVRPFAIAHRGFGENLGEDRSRPIENTVAAVEHGFEAGASVVEVDVQLTRDGRVATYHNDFFADGTCLNALTLTEIQARAPYVPSLEDVLVSASACRGTARSASYSARPPSSARVSSKPTCSCCIRPAAPSSRRCRPTA